MMKNVFLGIEQFHQAREPVVCLRLARQFGNGKSRSYRICRRARQRLFNFKSYVGFYHQPRFGRRALALDLMEEFRALIADSTVLSCITTVPSPKMTSSGPARR